MTINYITSDGWWDTDKTILPSICKEVGVRIFVMDDLESLKFPCKEMEKAKELIVFKQRFRMRDIRLLFQTIPYFFKILRNSIKKDSLNIFVASGSVYFLLLFLLFIPRKNTIIASHNYIEHTDSRNSMFAWMKKKYYIRFKYFMFFSKGQQEMFNKDFPQKKSFVTEMPPKDFGPLPQINHKDNKLTFLSFGIIRDYKRPDLLIKAANEVANENCRFVFAGICKEWEKYASLIENEKIFDLHIGFIDDSDVASYFADADFLVLPYMDATQSGPAMIAINYGIPLIASDQPAFERLIENDSNGFICKTGSLDSLIEVIRKALSLTKAELETMKNNQREFKKRYLKNNNPWKKLSDFQSTYML